MTSSIWLPCESAICLPSGETANAKISPLVNELSFRDEPPASGTLREIIVPDGGTAEAGDRLAVVAVG